jgi:hypothetical protein
MTVYHVQLFFAVVFHHNYSHMDASLYSDRHEYPNTSILSKWLRFFEIVFRHRSHMDTALHTLSEGVNLVSEWLLIRNLLVVNTYLKTIWRNMKSLQEGSSIT